MASRPKTPRRQKPPIQPRRSDQYGTGDVSPDQQRLIGLVVLNFAKLAHNLEDVLWSFLGLTIDEGGPLTSRLSTDFKIEMFKSLAKAHLRGDLLDDTLECAQLINGYKEDRNFIVHGSWGTLMPENVPVCASLRPQAPPGEVIAETFPKNACWRSSMGSWKELKTFSPYATCWKKRAVPARARPNVNETK
jgi:hypothetical protein